MMAINTKKIDDLEEVTFENKYFSMILMPLNMQIIYKMFCAS